MDKAIELKPFIVQVDPKLPLSQVTIGLRLSQGWDIFAVIMTEKVIIFWGKRDMSIEDVDKIEEASKAEPKKESAIYLPNYMVKRNGG